MDEARCLAGGAGAMLCANFPASAIGGGALNFVDGPPLGGDGVRSGDVGGESICCEFMFWLSGRFLRDGGGAGGGPLLDEIVIPVFWELTELKLPGAAEGGGGGGGACPRRSMLAPFEDTSRLPLASLACFCSI